MQLHRSNRAEALVDALARVVAEPLEDPFEAECIVVQGRGVERWLSLELAERLGVFAHAEFPFPKAFLQKALAAVSGAALDAGDEWEPEALLWTIADLLPSTLEDPRFAPIRIYLRDDAADDKLLALSRRIAETFDHYAVYRPEMVLAWERGDDAATVRWAGLESGWQSALWRALVERQGPGHFAARIRDLVAALEAGRAISAGLPSRASLFGLSTLPPLFVTAFAALSRRVELHAFVQSPSFEYWGWIRSEREALRTSRGSAVDGLVELDDLHLDEGHPLLASLGRVGRDFQEILEERVDYQESDEDLYVDPAVIESGGRLSLLRSVQSDILALRNRGGPDASIPRLVLEPDDRSVSVHACHGPMREAEVLRNQLLDLFAKDPSLEPHDVVVMAPDAALYAPYLEAAFAPDGEDGVAIPCHVADRGARAVFPVVEAWSRLIEVLPGRLTKGELLELLGMDCIRRRFGITADEEPLLRAWIDASGVRWGIDEAHREREGQPAAVENTWRFGLDRLFVGMAIEDGPERLFGEVRPQSGVEGTEAESLGRLAEFTAALFDLHDRVRGAHPVAQWVSLLTEVLDRLIDVEGEGAHERQVVLDGLSGLAAAAERAGHRSPVGLVGLREALDSWVGRTPVGGGFLTGAVTICELLPMRSIPFRVVCLLGLNDGAFPRVSRKPGFDLICARRRVGDRSSRDDDRQLFLEAMLSAREHLLVTFIGRDIHDNEPRSPAVVVGELLDHVARAFEPPGDDPESCAHYQRDAVGWARERLVVEHPLTPWSPGYFETSDPVARLFSYSGAWASAAKRLVEPGVSLTPFVASPLMTAVDENEIVPLDALQAFFDHPARYLVRDVLNVRLGFADEIRPDREPLDLEGLEAFSVGDELLDLAMSGREITDTYPRIRAQGILPLGEAGRGAHAEILAEVMAVATRARSARAGVPVPAIDVDIDCDGIRVVGRLDSLFEGGRVVQRFAKLGHRFEFEAWIAHLLLCVIRPAGVAITSHVAGRPGDEKSRLIRFDEPTDPLVPLKDLLEIFRMGRTRPLPLFPRVSRKYATILARSDDPSCDEQGIFAAYEIYADSARGRAEGDDPFVKQLFGENDPLASSYRPVGIESPGYDFRDLSCSVFGPLLACRKVVS